MRPRTRCSTTTTLRRVRIVLDPERCTGHGRCYTLSPELFDSDDEGHSVVLHEQVPEGLEDSARTAAENCPEDAIQLVD
jgi:ferredoxin